MDRLDRFRALEAVSKAKDTTSVSNAFMLFGYFGEHLLKWRAMNV